MLDKNVLTIDQIKVQKATHWNRPQTLKEVQSFLGLLNFFRDFIHHFSGMAFPLYNIKLVEPQEIVWDDACESAFITLKDRLFTAPMLQQGFY